MKYPNIIFFRYDKYSAIDSVLKDNMEGLLCNLNITSKKEDLNHMFDPNYHVLVTFGGTFEEYTGDFHSILPIRMLRQWLHINTIDSIESFNNSVNYCYMSTVMSPQHTTRPIFSIFTTCYKSYDKIYRAYESVKNQTMKDWEWVVMDDSPGDEHFNFLRNLFKEDKRVRLYRGADNNGSIGNVKNIVVMLCRGKYVIELDHDDEILPHVLADATDAFDKDNELGFIYMDYTNIYENGANFKYGDHFSLGYAGYYMQHYKGRWIYVASTPNVNNITLSHIVSIPNHPRIWRHSALMKMGNYSEYLPISDDYELFIRTAVNTKILKIHKLGYVQYMNDSGNNFSLIRNSEINRLCTQHIKPLCFDKYKVNQYMKENNAWEDEKYVWDVQTWKRTDYTHRYINMVQCSGEYKKQYAVIGMGGFFNNIERIRELYGDPKNDIIVLDNMISHHELCRLLEINNMFRMKCYSITDITNEELERYFLLTYKSCSDWEIIV